jgi:hypothetical protein
MYGVELTNPTIQEFVLQTEGVVQYFGSSEIPIAIAKVRLAPFDPTHISMKEISMKNNSYQSDPILE